MLCGEKVAHLAHPRGFWVPFLLIWSRFPENQPKRLKIGVFAIFAKFLLKWLENPFQTSLGTKKSYFLAPELKNGQKRHFPGF